MKQFILSNTLILALALSIHARDWGFSADTVYEDTIKTGVKSVLLTNNGSDTLKIDTSILEVIRPDMQYCQSAFFVNPITPGIVAYGSIFYKGLNYKTSYSLSLTLNIPPNQTKTLYHLIIDYPLSPLATLEKSSVKAARGDTIVARLILLSSLNRGADTVILIGTWDNTGSGIINRYGLKSLFPDVRFFDVNGRSLKKPELGPRFLSVPLLSPKK